MVNRQSVFTEKHVVSDAPQGAAVLFLLQTSGSTCWLSDNVQYSYCDKVLYILCEEAVRGDMRT